MFRDASSLPRRTAWTLPLALMLAACGTVRTPPRVEVGEPAFRTINEPAMTATYAYLFANNASALQAGAATYCVGVGNAPNPLDPSPTLLAAVRGVSAKAQPASSCRITTKVTDAQGRPALFFGLEEIDCSTGDDCLFQGGYHEGNSSPSQGNYRARRVNGVWQVMPEGPQAIS